MSNENIESTEPEETQETHNEVEIETDSPNEDGEDTGDSTSEESKYKEGDPLTFVKVRFPGNAKSFPFLMGRRKFSYGQKVVAMSDRGVAVGYINSFPYDLPFDKSMLPIKYIQKVATEQDLEKEREHVQKQRNAEEICLRLIEKHSLDMNLTHVEFTQFGKKSVFYFTAPARVDFRGLVKDLVSDLKMRIELRQISVRDRAAAIGGIGPCGLQLCCSYFLGKYGNVGIKMAKNQNLTLIPSKLNGACSQLKCCLQYEDDVYQEKRNQLPRENALIKVQNGDIGKVTRLHILYEQFELLTTEGKRRRYTQDQFLGKESYMPENFEFPKELRHIIDETSTLVGAAPTYEYHTQPENQSYFREEANLDVSEDDIPSSETLPDNEALLTTSMDDDSSDSDKRRENRHHNRQRPDNRNNKRQAQGPNERRDDNPNRNRNKNRNRNRNRNRNSKNQHSKGGGNNRNTPS